MEHLKRILRQAVATKPKQLRLEAGKNPETVADSGTTVLPNEPAVDQAWMKTIMAMLFPGDPFSRDPSTPAKGTLSLVGIGRIGLLGRGGDKPRLHFYFPPDGESLLQRDLTSWSAEKEQPEAPVSTASPFSLSTAGEEETVQLTPQLNDSPANIYQPISTSILTPQKSAHSSSSESKSDPSALPTPAELFGTPVRKKKEAPRPAASPLDIPIPPTPSPMAEPTPNPPEPIVADASAPPPDQAFSPPPPPRLAVREPREPLSIPLEPAQEQQSIEPSPGLSSEPMGSTAEIEALLGEMIQRKSSDLHISSNEKVSFRLDGDIVRTGQAPLTSEQVDAMILPILAPRNHEELQSDKDTDFAYTAGDGSRFRVNVYTDLYGHGAAFRHIPSQVPSIAALNLPKIVTSFCNLARGLVLVTGPTGSGKSTTLAAMIDHINRTRKAHLLTIEDPIEFVYKPSQCIIHQREIHQHAKSFPRSLRAALRENPDIVLIGEMRDLETIATAIEVAETGHLVFGTLHTNTAISTVDRIVDQFSADRQEQIRMMLAASLKGVVAQTLVKKKGGGRVGAYEILVVNDAVSAMIRERKTHMLGNHMQSQKQEGNILLNDALLGLIQAGLVESKDAFAKAVARREFYEMLRSKNIPIELEDMLGLGHAGETKAQKTR